MSSQSIVGTHVHRLNLEFIQKPHINYVPFFPDLKKIKHKTKQKNNLCIYTQKNATRSSFFFVTDSGH